MSGHMKGLCWLDGKWFWQSNICNVVTLNLVGSQDQTGGGTRGAKVNNYIHIYIMSSSNTTSLFMIGSLNMHHLNILNLLIFGIPLLHVMIIYYLQVKLYYV